MDSPPRRNSAPPDDRNDNEPPLSPISPTTATTHRIDLPPPAEEQTALLDVVQSDHPMSPRFSSAPPSLIGVSWGRKDGKRQKFWKRLNYYVPSTQWIPNYRVSYLGGDILSGLTIACILIPQSISYATSLAELSPLSGLFSASFPGMMYALLGTCRQLNVAPEAALSLLLGQMVSEIRHSLPDPHGHVSKEVGVHVATAITLQAGLISFLLGFFRLGFIDVILSRALLRGFITAIAIIIMVEQLIAMFGLTALKETVHPSSTFDKIVFLVEHINHYHGLTAAVSWGALAVLIAIRSLKARFPKYVFIYRFPEVLGVVILSTYFSTIFDWKNEGLDVLGKVKIHSGGSFFRFPIHGHNFYYLKRTTPTALLISVCGFLDSIVAAKAAAARYGYFISGNRELVALGASNIFASFVPGTLPAYGSITRTQINGDVGMKTQFSAFVCSAAILVATFFFLPFMEALPKCVLASIILLVVFSLLSETPHDLVYYTKLRAWVDLSLMVLTFILSIVWNIEVGIVCSLIFSLVLVVYRSSKTRMSILGRIPGTDRWKPVNEIPEAEEPLPGVLIVRIRDNLDFANTAQLKERLRRLELYGMQPHHPSDQPKRTPASAFVFHMADCESCDATATYDLYDMLKEYMSRDATIFMTHVRPMVMKTFRAAGVVDLLGSTQFLPTVMEAVTEIETRQGGYQRRWISEGGAQV